MAELLVRDRVELGRLVRNGDRLSTMVTSGVVAVALLGTVVVSAQDLEFDLQPHADERSPLANPHKGWYHHFPDNHPDKYAIARDADLLKFPGMDHLYVRLAWSYLEPRDGQFDWPVIDRIIDKWTARGLGIAFRISCRETSTDRIEQQYATPRWVVEAGAQGGHFRMGQATGPDGPWEPVYDDPVFLAKLDRFLAAFAARYDGRPWLRYVDIGSIGDSGEGHSWAGSRRECGLAARLRHVDLHLAHFRRTQRVVSDDFVHALSNLPERQTLHDYVLKHGIGYRDDSILVNGYCRARATGLSSDSGGFDERMGVERHMFVAVKDETCIPQCAPLQELRPIFHHQELLSRESHFI